MNSVTISFMVLADHERFYNELIDVKSDRFAPPIPRKKETVIIDGSTYKVDNISYNYAPGEVLVIVYMFLIQEGYEG